MNERLWKLLFDLQTEAAWVQLRKANVHFIIRQLLKILMLLLFVFSFTKMIFQPKHPATTDRGKIIFVFRTCIVCEVS